MIFCLPGLFAAAVCFGGGSEVGGRCDFDSARFVKGDECRIIGAFGVSRRTNFDVADEESAEDKKILVVEAKEASGFLIFRIKGVDLRKYPYMRWRWRIVRRLNLRDDDTDEPDDQACVVYIVDGSQLNQKCVGYRWEHNTPVGAKRMLNYAGLRKVQAICLRNRKTPIGEWVEEERNVVADFKAAFGRIPSPKFVISIGGNSQHSNSDTRVEIDYIEFRSAPKPEK